jgi:hypothetical protein
LPSFLTLAGGFLAGGLVLLVAALPAELQMARGDSYVPAGRDRAGAMLVLGFVLAAGWLALASLPPLARAAEQPGGGGGQRRRAGHCLPACYSGLLHGLQQRRLAAGDDRRRLAPPRCRWGATFWYLTRAHVRAYLG